jgi:predicted amidophosphoribosyltransferase
VRGPKRTAKKVSLITPRFTCSACGESFDSDPAHIVCPRCGKSQVRPARGGRFYERDPSGSVLAEALNESLRRLKAQQQH